MEDILKNLTIQEKFKIAKTLGIYPHWDLSYGIDENWCKRVMEVIDENRLKEILLSL